MTRARSKSIVQKIALDVATHDDDQFDSEFAPTIKKRVERKRSNSTSSIMSPKKETSGERIAVFDGYPLTLKETSRIWSHHLSSYNHDIIISDEAIDTIQALTNDSILGFQTKCNINLTSVSALIDQSNDVITLLNDLTFKYDYVSEETSDFAKKSQQLIDKKTQLEEISYEISNNLEMFESLDSITKILTNTPGINIVKKQSFHQTLFKLDNCLNFINLHPKYREAETYNVRFRQCMTRSLTLIRNYLIEDLKDLQGDISGKLVKSLKSNGSSGFSFDLFLYTSFNDHLNPLDSNNYYYNFSNLCFEIYKRIGGHQEYIGLYNDVTTQYFKIRSSLLNDYIWNQIDTLLEEKESEELNLVQFIQNNISFFKKMLYKELELFQRYFIQQQDKEDVGTLQGSTKWIGSSVYSELIEWFKSLLEPLYDTLRNKIIREINIGVLCEITTLLQKYYEFEDNSMNSTYNLQNGIINFGELFEPILQDVQARLIFRIQLYVDEKLLNYKAKPEDLHVGHRRASAIGITNDKNTTSGNAALVSPDSLDYEFEDNLFKEWFPQSEKLLQFYQTYTNL